jgi:hypothetical protein
MRECSFAKGLRGLGWVAEGRVAASDLTRGCEGPIFEKKVIVVFWGGEAETPI